jgi:hypothetical protein
MMSLLLKNEDLARVLRSARTIAMIGLSDKPWRDSYAVAGFLKSRGYRIVPVNPTIPSALGIPAVPSLTDVEEPVDIVNVFRRAEFVPDIVNETIALGIGTLWLQSGIQHDYAARRAADASINVIMDRCIAVAHTLLIR